MTTTKATPDSQIRDKLTAQFILLFYGSDALQEYRADNKLVPITVHQGVNLVMEQRHQILTEVREALEDMVWQFGYRFDGGGKKPPCIGTGGLSALEHAFGALGWDDPKKCPDSSCDIQGCQKWPGSGNPIPNGDYWSLCTDHMMMLNEKPNNYLYMKKKAGRGYNAKERKERLAR